MNLMRELFEQLMALKDVDESASVRAEKLVCEGKLKHREDVIFEAAEGGGVLVSFERGSTSWEVEFLPNGKFGISLEFEGSGDGRIIRVLKALGQIHRKRR